MGIEFEHKLVGRGTVTVSAHYEAAPARPAFDDPDRGEVEILSVTQDGREVYRDLTTGEVEEILEAIPAAAEAEEQDAAADYAEYVAEQRRERGAA